MNCGLQNLEAVRAGSAWEDPCTLGEQEMSAPADPDDGPL